MKRWFWIAWILSGLVFALAPIAWASPPDPTWIAGMYDNADFDDVVTYLTSTAVAVPAFSVVDECPVFAQVRMVPAPNEKVELALLVLSKGPRAPPPA
jgi:hypothetical protein